MYIRQYFIKFSFRWWDWRNFDCLGFDLMFDLICQPINSNPPNPNRTIAWPKLSQQTQNNPTKMYVTRNFVMMLNLWSYLKQLIGIASYNPKVVKRVKPIKSRVWLGPTEPIKLNSPLTFDTRNPTLIVYAEHQTHFRSTSARNPQKFGKNFPIWPQKREFHKIVSYKHITEVM